MKGVLIGLFALLFYWVFAWFLCAIIVTENPLLTILLFVSPIIALLVYAKVTELE